MPLVIPVPPRVLLLQEETPFRARLDAALRRQGFETVATPDASAALDLTSKAPGFDMAVVDLGLPVTPGTLVVRALREQDPGLFVAMLPGTAAREEVAEAYQAGAAAALRPTASPEEVAGLLKAQLPAAGRRRQRAEERPAPKRSFGSGVLAWVLRRRVRRAAGLAAACLLLGAGLAAGLDSLYGIAGRPDRSVDAWVDLLRASGGQRGMDRRILIEQLRLAQEANDITRRYYDAQLDPRRLPPPAR